MKFTHNQHYIRLTSPVKREDSQENASAIYMHIFICIPSHHCLQASLGEGTAHHFTLYKFLSFPVLAFPPCMVNATLVISSSNIRSLCPLTSLVATLLNFAFQPHSCTLITNSSFIFITCTKYLNVLCFNHSATLQSVPFAATPMSKF